MTSRLNKYNESNTNLQKRSHVRMEVNPLYVLHEVHGACKVLREKCCVEAVDKIIQENKTIAIDKFMFFIDIFSHLDSFIDQLTICVIKKFVPLGRYALCQKTFNVFLKTAMFKMNCSMQKKVLIIRC